jgi:hypothetical protein
MFQQSKLASDPMQVDLKEQETQRRISEIQQMHQPGAQVQAPQFIKSQPQEHTEAGGEQAPHQQRVGFQPLWKIERGRRERPSEHITTETGTIYFFYRPKIGLTHCSSVNDIQRAYILMVPDEEETRPISPSRLIIIPLKHLPSIATHERLWGTVWKVSHDLDDVRAYLLADRYESKTRGIRESQPARPVGRGVYAIVRDQPNATHLCYVLSVPRQVGAPQRALGIRPEATYVLSIKSPFHANVPGAPRSRHPPKYPPELQQAFGKYAWIGANPPELLDYEGAEILLIGGHDSIAEEAGEPLRTMGVQMAKLLNPQIVLKELHATSQMLPLDALEGQWT